MKRILNVLCSPVAWLLAGLLLPEASWAVDASSMFNIPPTDLSKSLVLDRLFPPGDAPGPFGQIALVVNSCLLVAAGFWVMWLSIVGVLHTAHDGEMLGKKWSSLWLPVRLSLGSAMLFPISAKGLCGAQLVVIYIVSQSVGLADTVWNAYVRSGMAQSVFATSSVPKDDLKKVAVAMLKSNVCLASIENSRTQGAPDSLLTSNGQPPKIGWTMGETYTGFELKYGISNDDSQIASCGRIVLSRRFAEMNMGNLGTLTNGQNPQSLALEQVQKSLWANQKEEMLLLNKTMAENATNFVTKHTPVLARVDQSVALYETHIQAATAKIASSNATFQHVADNAAKTGWLAAGSWFIHLINFQQGLSDVVNAIPKLEQAQTPDLIKESLIARDMASLDRALNDERVAFMGGLETQARLDQGDDGSPMFWVSDIGGHLAKAMIKNLGGGNYFTSGNAAPNPILSAQALGSKMLNFTWVLFGICVGAAVLAPLGVTIVLVSALLSIVALLATGGILLSWVLPMTPYVYWAFGVLAWIILVCECFFAASFWALAHLHPEGHDVVGGGGEGYKLLLSLFFTPVLMICGFVVAATLVQIIGDYVNQTYSATMDMVRGGTGMAVWGIVGAVSVYIGLMLGLVKMAFGEIHRFPDRVLRILNLSVQAISQITSEGTSHSSQHNTAIIAAINQGKQAAAGGTQSLSNAVKQHKAEEIAKRGNIATQLEQNSGVYNAPKPPSETNGGSNADPSKK